MEGEGEERREGKGERRGPKKDNHLVLCSPLGNIQLFVLRRNSLSLDITGERKGRAEEEG